MSIVRVRPNIALTMSPATVALAGRKLREIFVNSGKIPASVNLWKPLANNPAAKKIRSTLVVRNASNTGSRMVAANNPTETSSPPASPPINPVNISCGLAEKKMVERKRTISNPSLNTAVNASQKRPFCSSFFSVSLILTIRRVL